MADINKIIPKIKKWEGGYSNHPSDAGGCTQAGVTIGVFRKYYGKEKTCEDLKKITDEQWLTILKTGYWDKINADKIQNQSIANLCVDMAWCSGPITAAKKIQRVLGVTADGLIGKISLAAINNANQKELFDKLKEMRRIWLNNIVLAKPSQKVFIKGWLRRLDSYTFEE